MFRGKEYKKRIISVENKTGVICFARFFLLLGFLICFVLVFVLSLALKKGDDFASSLD